MNEHPLSRREFLRSLARGAAVAGLAGLALSLGRRAEGFCANDRRCPGCPTLPQCPLPEAAAVRQSRGPTQGSRP